MKLQGKTVAILATDGFEQSELDEPMAAIEKEGGIIHVISLKSGKIKGWKNGDWAGDVKVTKALEEARSEDYDGLILPGGVINPDKLRKESMAIEFIQGFFQGDHQKPVAKFIEELCEGPH